MNSKNKYVQLGVANKKCWLVVLLCILCSIWGNLFAENVELIDSLKGRLSEVSGAEKITIYNQLSSELMYDKFEAAFDFNQKALALATEMKIDTARATCYNIFGDIYYLNSNLDSSMVNYRKCLEISEKINWVAGIGKGYAGVGLVYAEKLDLGQAVEYYSKAYEIREKLNDTTGMNNMLNNIGMVYYREKQYDKAIEYLERCLRFDELKNDKSGVAYSCSNIGMIYYMLDDYEKSLPYLMRSLKLREELSNFSSTAATCNNIGNVLSADNQNEEALKYYLRALELKRKVGDEVDYGVTLNNIGHFYSTGLNNPKEAIPKLEEAQELFRKYDERKYIRNNAEYLAYAYSLVGRYDEAYQLQKLYSKLQDSLVNENKNKLVTEMSAKFDTEQKEKQIEIQNLEIKNQQANIEQEKTMKLVYFGAGVVVLIILILVGIGFVQKRKDNLLLEEKNDTIHQKNEELNQQNEEIIAISDQIEYQNGILKKHNDNIMASISYAKRIQEAILPSDEYMKKYLPNSFVLYKPKDVVSGDFYWMARVEQRVFWAVVDCTGHGVPGALMSMIGADGLNKIVKERKVLQPSLILEQLTEHVTKSIRSTREGEEVKDGMDIALCSLDLETLELEYAGAYNPLWIRRLDQDDIDIIKATRRPIGRFRGKEGVSFDNHKLALSKGDQVYIFSDGYPDQFGGESGLKFTYRRFRTLLEANYKEDMKQQKEILEFNLAEWMSREDQLDDICVFGVRV